MDMIKDEMLNQTIINLLHEYSKTSDYTVKRWIESYILMLMEEEKAYQFEFEDFEDKDIK